MAKDDAVALCRAGHALAYAVGDFDSGAGLIDLALQIDPNLAVAWYASGWIRAYLGEAEIAIECLARAMCLSPLDPEINLMQCGTAVGHFVLSRYDEAASWAQKALQERPRYLSALRVAAASAALAGRLDEAHLVAERLRQLDPSLRVSNLKDRLPFRRHEDLARFEDGLRRAGLPE